MRFVCFVVAACSTTCGVHAGLVEMRIVERTGQLVADAADSQLDFAVQVRVNSSAYVLSGAGFGLRLFGEAQTRGQFSFGRISRIDDHTYTPEIGGFAPGFESGVAAQYRFLVDLNSGFNGLINASGGSWTQTPDQDIGLVGARSGGARFLQTPRMDTDGDEQPDTAAPGATTAIIPENIRRDYFATENWIDVYRFRYRVIDLTPRALDLRVADIPTSLDISVASGEIRFVNGLWGQTVQTVPHSEVSIVNWQGTVVPAPAATGMLLFCAAFGRRRPRR